MPISNEFLTLCQVNADREEIADFLVEPLSLRVTTSTEKKVILKNTQGLFRIVVSYGSASDQLVTVSVAQSYFSNLCGLCSMQPDRMTSRYDLTSGVDVTAGDSSVS